jgi:hypothetical protein
MKRKWVLNFVGLWHLTFLLARLKLSIEFPVSVLGNLSQIFTHFFICLIACHCQEKCGDVE